MGNTKPVLAKQLELLEPLVRHEQEHGTESDIYYNYTKLANESTSPERLRAAEQPKSPVRLMERAMAASIGMRRSMESRLTTPMQALRE